jgi:hypothetical protein
MYENIKTIINLGGYVLENVESIIERHYAVGELTSAERNELLTLAAEKADDTKQIDVAAMLADLNQRVSRLESQELCVWVSGMVTAKGQTVLYDIDKDGVLDRVRYDGGRATTSSKPGNIEGWVLVDGSGNATHRLVKVDGVVTLVPIEE